MLELSLAQILFKNAHIYLFLQERIVRQEKQQQLWEYESPCVVFMSLIKTSYSLDLFGADIFVFVDFYWRILCEKGN